MVSQCGWSKNRQLVCPLTESDPKSCQGFKTLSVKWVFIWHTTCSPRVGTETIPRRNIHWPVGEARLRGVETPLSKMLLLHLLFKEPGEASKLFWHFFFPKQKFWDCNQATPSGSSFASLGNYFSCSVVKQVCLFHPKLRNEQNYLVKEPQRWIFFHLQGKKFNKFKKNHQWESLLWRHFAWCSACRISDPSFIILFDPLA